MTMIHNLTPHAIHICDADGAVIHTIEPSATPARVAVTAVVVGEADGIPIRECSYGAIEGLPDPVPGTVYITSLLVAQAARRSDVMSPDDTVRDAQGRIIGCRALARIPGSVP